MGITLAKIDAAFHSITVKQGANELGIAGDGSIAVTDNGGSLTVDGTVAATQSGTWDIGTVTTLTSITNDVNIADGGNVISIDDAGGSITVDGTLGTTPGGFPSWKVTQETVGTSEGELVSTPLANRVRLLIQNFSSNDIFVKEATGVAVTDLEISKGDVFEADLDDTANIFAIAGAGSNSVQVVEYASS